MNFVNYFTFYIILISLVSLYVVAQTEALTDDQNPLSEETDEAVRKINTSSLENKDVLSNNYQSKAAINIPKNMKNELTTNNDLTENKETEENQEKKENMIPNKKITPKKIPMKCVQDYVKYCESKFVGLKFKDGCHSCECTKTNKNFCKKGSCTYYATSYLDVLGYCNKINKENSISYEKQITNLKKNEELKIAKNLKVKNLSRSNSFNITNKKNKSKIFEMHQIVRSISGRKFKNEDKELEKLLKSDNIDKFINENILNKSNKENNLNSILGKNSNEKILRPSKRPAILISKDENGNKIFEITKENSDTNKINKTKNNINNFSNEHEVRNKIYLNKIIGKKRNNQEIINNPVKASLSKISEKNIIQAIVHNLAWIELTVDKVKRKIKKESLKDKDRIKLLDYLKNIQHRNKMYKMKILKIVQKEMLKNKENRSYFHKGSKYMKDFKSTLRDLMQLNKSLRKIQNFDLVYLSKRYKRHYHGGSQNLKMPFAMIPLLIMLWVTLWNS